MNKRTKLGITSLSILALGVAIPLAPTAFAAENQPNTEVVNPPAENQQPLKYRVYYNDLNNGKLFGSKEAYVSPGKTAIEYSPEFPGYTPTVPGFAISYEQAYEVTNEGHDVSYIRRDTDGIPFGRIDYVKNEAPETPAEQPQTNPEVPATKPETPADKPSDKPAEQPQKPATKPTDTNKPVVKPTDNSKPEVKPSQQAENTDPKDDKMKTLPNTGESQSSLGLFGLALAAIGLAGLTYKGRRQG